MAKKKKKTSRKKSAARRSTPSAGVKATKAAPKRSTKRSAAPGTKPPPRLPRRQLTLPAGYLADGSGVASLRDVLSSKVPTLDGPALNDDERLRLTLLRIEAQPTFELVGPGMVLDKARALDEVRRRTPIGEMLIAIENRTIEFVRETADVQRRRREQRYRDRKRARGTPNRARGKHR
jgi:hypothetical protein